MKPVIIPWISVNTVDTASADRSFNAGHAFAPGRGDSIDDAATSANPVAALSTNAKGAQTEMPKPIEVENFFANQ